MALQITAIQSEHLPQVGEFLHAHLNRRFTPERWIGSLVHRWSNDRPNHGMQLHDGEQLVGVFCAIYSDQVIDGRIERFCNPHSWCVLDSHRRHGIGLLLQLIKQPGFHFTMFTPNPTVTAVFRGLKFKDLDAGQRVALNVPSLTTLQRDAFAESHPENLANRLSGQALADYLAHRDIPWLRFAAFGQGAEGCLAIYKPTRWKRLPCAWIMHVSDADVFLRHQGLLRHHLLLQHGFASLRIESRWLPRAPWLSIAQTRLQPKLFLSKTLEQHQIRDAYSELMALDV